MSPFKNPNFKTSRGRKPIFKLLRRQRLRRFNLLRQNDQKDHNIRLDNPVIDAANESHIGVAPVSEYHCSLDKISHVSEHSEFSIVGPMDVASCSSLCLKRNISPTTFQSDGNDCNSNAEVNNFQESLASALIQGNLTHTQGNIILKTLRSLPCLSYLPKDSRTLLNTPREAPIVSKVYPGEYLHIGLAKALIRILRKTPPNLIPDIIKVDWSTDGARLNKSGNMQIWPIQCSVANIANSKPEVVGIYKGPKKPQSINVFLDQFIDDVLKVIDSGGVSFLQKKKYLWNYEPSLQMHLHVLGH